LKLERAKGIEYQISPFLIFLFDMDSSLGIAKV
jgi:hypothetical protein